MSGEREPDGAGRRPAAPGFGGLCPTCAKVRIVTSRKGSSFLMCSYSSVDSRFSKYPPQPVRSCRAFEKVQDEA
jgi:hypothetical protein